MTSAKKTPARKAVPAVAGEVDTGATHVVLATPKREEKALFTFEFSEGASSQSADGAFVSGEKKASFKMDATSLTEAAQRLQTLVPQVLTSLSPEQFDEGMRRAVAIRAFMLESVGLVVNTLAQARQVVDQDRQTAEWEQASHEKQLEAEFPGWKAKFHGEVVREDDDFSDAERELEIQVATDALRKGVKAYLDTSKELLAGKGWDEAQLMQLDEQFELCDDADDLKAYIEALRETVAEAETQH